MKNEQRTESKLKIIEYINLERAVSIREIKEHLNVGFTTAERLLNDLVISRQIDRKIKTFKGRDYYAYLKKDEQPTPPPIPTTQNEIKYNEKMTPSTH